VGAAVIALNVGVAEGEPVGADVSILSNVGAFVGSVGDFVGAIVVDEVVGAAVAFIDRLVGVPVATMGANVTGLIVVGASVVTVIVVGEFVALGFVGASVVTVIVVGEFVAALIGDKVGLALTGAKVKVTGAEVVGAALTGAKVIGTLTAVGARLTGAAVIGATEIGADEVGAIVLIVVGASVIAVEMVGSYVGGDVADASVGAGELVCAMINATGLMQSINAMHFDNRSIIVL